MKISSLVLAIVFCGSALAQTGALMRGGRIQFSGTTYQGIQVNFWTGLEPPSPSLAGIVGGGTTTDSNGIHRYLDDKSLRKFFGYDLQIERQPQDAYRVTFRPLSITPANAGLDSSFSWSVVPLTGYPPPQIVFSGATIAVDLFTNPTTGQKIVDYVQISGQKEKRNVIAPGDTLRIDVLHMPAFSGRVAVRSDGFISMFIVGEIQAAGLTPLQLSSKIAVRLSKERYPYARVSVQIITIDKDSLSTLFPPGDTTAIRIMSPRVMLNGTLLRIAAKYNQDVAWPVVWFYLPGHGRYVLSLVPRANLQLSKAGEVRGSTLTFTKDGDSLGLICDSEITLGSARRNLYVFHDPAWRPNDPAAADSLLLGSGDSVQEARPTKDSVMEHFEYYISGEVRKPGAYPLIPPKTVYQALNEAGGLADFAKSTKIYVMRGQTKIPFNYKEVKMGKNLQQNILLQYGDVIVVP